MSRKLSLAAALVAAVLVGASASAMSIMELNEEINGSFEVGFLTTPENGGLLPNVLAGDASPAFDFTTGTGIVADGTAGPPPAASLLLDSPGNEDQVPYDGANSAYLLVSGGPAQAQVFGGTFETVPGTEYTIEWWISRAPNRFSAQSQLRIYDAPSTGGLFAYQFSGLFTQDDTIAPTWEQKSLTFVAPSDGVHIQFYAQNREGATPESVTLVDGISVVPEPATMILCALAAVLLRRR